MMGIDVPSLEREKISVKDFIEAHWGEILSLFDKIIDYKLIEIDIVLLVGDVLRVLKNEIDRKGDAFWAFKNKEAYALGYIQMDKVFTKVIVNTEYKELLIAVEIDWFELRCSVEVEVNNNRPRFKFLVDKKT